MGLGAQGDPGHARGGESALPRAAAERVTQQTLELLLGLVASHAQTVGASEGPTRLAVEATSAWAPLFLEMPTHLYATAQKTLMRITQQPCAVLPHTQAPLGSGFLSCALGSSLLRFLKGCVLPMAASCCVKWMLAFPGLECRVLQFLQRLLELPHESIQPVAVLAMR